VTLELEFIGHYKRFHDYMDKSHALLGLYPSEREKDAFLSWQESVPREVDCIIKCFKIEDDRILKVFREWESPCQNYDLVSEIIDKEVPCHIVADITYLFWRYSDVVRHLREKYQLRENDVLLEQTIVTSCTAYECFLKEMIPWILKNNPEIAKRFLGKLNKPIKDLGKYNFDPYSNVEFLYEDVYGKKLMPVFPDIHDFYRDILKINILEESKNRELLENIFQARHCIVHNAGKPDDAWIRKTNNAPFPKDLKAVKEAFVKIHDALHDASTAIYKAMKLNEISAPWRKEGDYMVCKIDEIEKTLKENEKPKPVLHEESSSDLTSKIL